MTSLLAIDPGQFCGYAWTDDGMVHLEQSGVWDLTKASDPGERFGMLRAKVGEYHPEWIFYETNPGLRGHTLRWFIGYMAVVQCWAAEVGANFLNCNNSTLKKFATGMGNATKDEMCTAYIHKHAMGEYWLSEEPDDRIDALWLLRWGIVYVAALDRPICGKDCTT